MILETESDVSFRFFAPASLREISATAWPPYSAIAASMIVGVGQYRPVSQSCALIWGPSARRRTSPMTAPNVSQFATIGGRSRSLDGVVVRHAEADFECVAIKIGATNL